jgi:perosamine synthetase
MFIPLSIPEITDADQARVHACLASGWVSSAGPWVEDFEAQMAESLGSLHAVAVSSGTAALHLSLQVVGVQPGDLVLMPDLTFIAPAHALRYLGAEPVLVDVDPGTWQIDVGLTAQFLRRDCEPQAAGLYHRATGRRVAALLVVHALGYAAPLDPLLGLAQTYRIPLIEDAAEALGSRLQGRALGTFGQVGCLSFNGNKLLTTGGGGMILTADAELAARARHLSTQARSDAFTYRHDALGYNYRLSSMAAALGLSQLDRLDDTLARKRAIAQRYFDALPQLAWPTPTPQSHPNYWLMTALMPDRDALAARLQAEHIDRRCLWMPLHQQPLFQACPYLSEQRVSEQLFASALSLPSSVGLSLDQQQRVIATVQAEIGS